MSEYGFKPLCTVRDEITGRKGVVMMSDDELVQLDKKAVRIDSRRFEDEVRYSRVKAVGD